MKNASFVAVLTLAIILTSYLVQTQNVSRNSQALTTGEEISSNTFSPPLCPIETHLYVHEIDAGGNEMPLQNMPQWGFLDEVHSLLDEPTPISFNHPTHMRYNNTSSELSFIDFPDIEDVYEKNRQTYIQLIYDQNAYEIIKKEVKECSSNTGSWLCTDTEQELDTIYGIKLDCSMKLNAGWVVQKIRTDSQLNATEPIIGKECDTNHDGACNTIDLLGVIENYGARGENLNSDINKDGRIDSIDYSIVTEHILTK